MSKPTKKGRVKTNTRSRATDRISRLTGQVKALGVMTEKGEEWKKLLILAAAIQGASDEVAAELYQGYLESLTNGGPIAQEARKGLELLLKRI